MHEKGKMLVDGLGTERILRNIKIRLFKNDGKQYKISFYNIYFTK